MDSTFTVLVFAVVLVLLILIFMQSAKVGYYRENLSDFKTRLCRTMAGRLPRGQANQGLLDCLASESFKSEKPEKSKIDKLREKGKQRVDKIKSCRGSVQELKGLEKAKTFVSCISKESLCDPTLGGADCLLLSAAGLQ